MLFPKSIWTIIRSQTTTMPTPCMTRTPVMWKAKKKPVMEVPSVDHTAWSILMAISVSSTTPLMTSTVSTLLSVASPSSITLHQWNMPFHCTITTKYTTKAAEQTPTQGWEIVYFFPLRYLFSPLSFCNLLFSNTAFFVSSLSWISYSIK